MDIAGAQHYVECGSCDKYSKFYCNSCHSRLCEQCKKEHLRDKENRDHEVVLYSYRKIEFPVEICKKHLQKSKDLCCRDCKVAICSKCLIENHKGHDFEDIELVYTQKRSLCMNSVSDIRSTVLPKGFSLLEELQKHKTACMDRSSNMRSRLKDNAKILHNLVDAVSSELEESTNKIEKSITDDLNDQEKLLNDHITHLTETVDKYEQDILSKTPTELISPETPTCPIQPSVKDMPGFVKPCLPIYAEGQIEKDGIVKLLGNIIQSIDQQNETFNLKGTTKHITAEDIKGTKSKWVPSRDENNPKTLDQIYKEPLKEEQQRQMFLQQASAQQKAQGRGGGVGARGSRGPPNAGRPSDGWNTVGKPNIRVERQTIDPSRLMLIKQNVDESNIQLGPGSGANRFSGWQRGSTGSRGPPNAGRPSDGWNTVGKPNIRVERQTIDPSKLKLIKQNVDESNIQLGPGGGANWFSGWQTESTGGGARNSQEAEKSNAPSNRFSGWQRGSTGGGARNSQEAEKSNAPSNSMLCYTGPKMFAAAKELTEEEVEKKTIAILDEYLHVQDIKEAILSVEELNSPSVMHLVVSTAVNHVLERSSIARNQTGHFLHDLVKKGVIPVPVYIQGLTEVLQYAEDMEIDIPKIWQYFGELIGPMVQDGPVHLNFLRKATEPLKQSNKAGNLVAEVLHAACHREGHKKVGLLWRQSSLKWDEFVSRKDVKQFISDKKLEFTEGDGSQPSIPTVSNSLESIQEKLNELLLQKRVDNETIFDWIEENVDDKTIKSKKFVRVLMSAVYQSAITGSGNRSRVVPDSVKNRGVLLIKYLDHKAEFELQALYALQALVHKLEHPPGVLRTLFDVLYDEDIISEDAFHQWEKSTDPNEQEGKRIAMRQVVQFFKWLKEADEDMSDN